MNFSRALATIVVCLFMIQIIAAVPSYGQNEVTANIGILGEPSSFIPWTEISTYYYFHLYYDTLIIYDKQLNPIPSLARSWEISSDGTTWTFHIVDNATFQDGEKLTAKDVAFTLNFIINTKEVAKFHPYLAMITSIETPDDYTVVVHTDKAYAPSYLISQFPTYIPIVPEHIWSTMSPADALKSENKIGSGSYKFVEWKKGQYIKFERNNDWFAASRMPKVDTLIFVYFSNRETMIQALISGQIDMVTTVPPEVVRDLMSRNDIRVVIQPSLYLNEMAINVYAEGKHVRPALLDERLRVALSHAVDKQQMLDLVHLGYGTPGDSIVHGPSPWHNANLKTFDFNLTLASQMLDEAGYKMGPDGIRVAKGVGKVVANGVDVVVPDGTKLDFTVLVCTDVAKEERSTELIKGWWRQIGVNLNVKLTDGGTIGALNYGDDGKLFDFDMFVWSWSGGEVDPTSMLYLLTSDSISGWSETGWHNDEYDSLFKQQATAATDAQRKAMVDRMQELGYYASPYIVYYYLDGISAYRADRWQPPADFRFGPGAYGFNIYNQWVIWDLTPLSTQPTATSATTSATTSETAAPDNTPWIVAGVAILIAVVAIAAVAVRRKKPSGVSVP